MQLRLGPLRGQRSAARCKLLPLHTLSAPDWGRRVGERAPGARNVSNRLRRGQAADVAACGRRREVVLWRLRVLAVRVQPVASGSNRDPYGHVRRRPRRPAERPPVRQLRGSVGADSRRRATTVPLQPARGTWPMSSGSLVMAIERSGSSRWSSCRFPGLSRCRGDRRPTTATEQAAA